MAEVKKSNLYDTTGIPITKDACVVIVRTEWNDETVSALTSGACKILDDYTVAYSIITVPGAFEIPFAIKNHWDNTGSKPQAYVALGCVVKGDTPHFDYICKAVTEGIVQLNLTLPVPTIFGILTVNNQAQADERIGGKHGHKGEEAALTAIKMMHL
jgi:6,7-dimethyl-8-ribityllumazine synthase